MARIIGEMVVGALIIALVAFYLLMGVGPIQ